MPALSHRHRAPPVALAALLALPALGTPAWGAPVSALGSPATLTCARQGTMTIAPGLTMTHQELTLGEQAWLGPCVSSDGAMLSGVMRASGGSASGTCTSVYVTDAPFTIEWSDGTTSTGRALASSAGPIAFGIGELTSGRFAGTSFHTRPMLAPHHPERCASTGVTVVDHYGEIVFE